MSKGDKFKAFADKVGAPTVSVLATSKDRNLTRHKEIPMREKILRLFELTATTDTYMSFVDLMLAQIQMAYKDTDEEFVNTACARIRAVVEKELPGITEKFVQLYAETYNEEEINAMIAWHESPVGRKVNAMTKPLQIAGAAIGAILAPKIDAEVRLVALEFELVDKFLSETTNNN